jgi:phosphate:Na+ symporter
MQTANNFERIADHAVNIMEVAQNANSEMLEFSEPADKELEVLEEAVLEVISITIDAFENSDTETAKKIEPLEEVIDDMVVTLRDRHVERVKAGQCNTSSGMAFLDILSNLERIADQCSNVGLIIMSEKIKEIRGNHHAYVRELHKGGDSAFNQELAKRRTQYLSRI